MADNINDNIENNENDDLITLVDEETGEEFEMAVVDGFEYKDRQFVVLVTVDDEEEAEMVIAEKIDEADGSISIQTVGEDEEDEIYDYYDELCDEYFDDEDESEEE
jgi:uncharacterized protein YrzB (UPF0473 family)